MQQDTIDAVMWRYESAIQYRVEIYDPTDGTRSLFGFYEGLFGHVSVDFDLEEIGYWYYDTKFRSHLPCAIVTVYTGRFMDGSEKIKTIYYYYNHDTERVPSVQDNE